MNTRTEALPYSAAPQAAPAKTTPKTATQWWTHPRARKVFKVSAVVALIGLLSWFFFFRPFVSTDDARVAAVLVRLAPEGVSGKVIRINVTEGDAVKAGQTLLELDHAVAEANLVKAKARAEHAEQDLKRIPGMIPMEADKIRAEAQAAQADLRLAQLAYDRTFVKSPVDGVVIQKATEEGNILEANQTALTVADIEHAWVSANIEETAVASVKPGQPVTVHVDEGASLTGKVMEVRAATASQFALIQSENPSGNFTKLVQRIPIKIALDPHPETQLRAGQSVEIKIRVK